MKDNYRKQGNSSRIVLIFMGLIALAVSAGMASSITVAHAQGQITSEYTLLSPLPCLGNSCPGSNGSQTADFKTYIAYVYNLLIAVAAVVAVFMIVYGGFEYVTSTIPGVKADGLGRIQSALWGLLLILASYLILRTINPQLVQIPSTLVPQIKIAGNLNLTQNADTGYLSALQNQAGSVDPQVNQHLKDNNAQYTATSQAADATAAQITQLTGASDAGSACADANLGDTDVTDLCMQWYKQQQSLATTRADSQLTVDQAQMNDFLKGYLNDPKTYDYAGSVAGVNALYDQQYKDLVQKGATQQQLNALQDYKNSTISGLNLTNAANVASQTKSPGASVIQPIQMSAANIAQIQDPVIRQQQAQAALQSIASIGSSMTNKSSYYTADGQKISASQYYNDQLKTQITQLQGFATQPTQTQAPANPATP